MSKNHKHQSAPTPVLGPTLLMLRVSQCKTHPTNMRRVYPIADVQQMAESIRGRQGLIHALTVTDNGDGTYTVIDGNLRTTAGRLLGAACPLLKAEVVDQAVAEQHLTMAAANLVRFDVDPISEAMHYQRLLDEGYTKVEIAERTGTYYTRISNRLELLRYEPVIQDLIIQGKFPVGQNVIEAMLSISDPQARVKLAVRMAEQQASAKSIVAAADLLCERLADPKSRLGRAKKPLGRPRRPEPAGMSQVMPMMALAQDRTGLGIPNNDRPGWPALRAAARAMCAQCDIKLETLRSSVDEPAWTLITHAADATCADCNVRNVAGACNGCPGLELLFRLLRGAHAKLPTVAETAPTERRI